MYCSLATLIDLIDELKNKYNSGFKKTIVNINYIIMIVILKIVNKS